MNITYPAVIHHEGDTYWIEFPDLEGCHTFADTLEAVFSEAKEALSAYCSAILESGKLLPSASEISAIEHTSSDIIALIEAPIIEKQRSVKKNLTIPAWLNTAAEQHRINFSQVLQEALVERLNINP